VIEDLDEYDNFVMRVAHILTSKLSDKDQINAIRIRYRQAFFPEKPIEGHEIELISKLYKESND